MKFSANLTMLYQEHGFLDRFAAAARDGFGGVEFVSPYDYAPELVAETARRAGVDVVLFNSPAGNWDAGERGCACDPAQHARFRESIEKALIYAQALACPRVHIMAGLVPAGVSVEEAEAAFIENLTWAADATLRWLYSPNVALSLHGEVFPDGGFGTVSSSLYF